MLYGVKLRSSKGEAMRFLILFLALLLTTTAFTVHGASIKSVGSVVVLEQAGREMVRSLDLWEWEVRWKAEKSKLSIQLNTELSAEDIARQKVQLLLDTSVDAFYEFPHALEYVIAEFELLDPSAKLHESEHKHLEFLPKGHIKPVLNIDSKNRILLDGQYWEALKDSPVDRAEIYLRSAISLLPAFETSEEFESPLVGKLAAHLLSTLSPDDFKMWYRKHFTPYQAVPGKQKYPTYTKRARTLRDWYQANFVYVSQAGTMAKAEALALKDLESKCTDWKVRQLSSDLAKQSRYFYATCGNPGADLLAAGKSQGYRASANGYIFLEPLSNANVVQGTIRTSLLLYSDPEQSAQFVTLNRLQTRCDQWKEEFKAKWGEKLLFVTCGMPMVKTVDINQRFSRYQNYQNQGGAQALSTTQLLIAVPDETPSEIQEEQTINSSITHSAYASLSEDVSDVVKLFNDWNDACLNFRARQQRYWGDRLLYVTCDKGNTLDLQFSGGDAYSGKATLSYSTQGGVYLLPEPAN